MVTLNIASTLIGGLTLLASLLSQVALWQQKEYRWDRLKSHLKSPQGSLLNYPLVLLAISAIFAGWLSYFTGFTGLADLAGFTGLLLFSLHHALRIKKRGILRPEFTARAILTLLLSVLFSFYIPYSIFHIPQFAALQLASNILLIPIFIAASVSIVGLPFKFGKRRIIAQATKLRSSHKNLTVVGITGSYGKTSTKHFLEQILKSAGKKVAATGAHHNTPIGIGQDVIRHLTPELEIYIAELGAYRVGEITELAHIVQPQIGVVTAIGNQHLDLFGSQENILKAKWELVNALPEDGIAVLNRDDSRIHQAAQGLKQKTLWYSVKQASEAWVQHVSLEATRITCTLHLESFSRSVTLPLASEALLGSAVAAAAAALALNIPAEKIAAALETLTPFPRTMEIKPGKNGATIIDDSYSANEVGTLLAIRHLARFREPNKRIVLLPFLELGKDTAAAHQQVRDAAKTAGAELYMYTGDPKSFTQEVSEDLSKESVILLEGRLPDVVRDSVLRNNNEPS